MPTSLSDFLPAHAIYQNTSPGIRYYKILKTLRKIPKNISKRPYIDEMDHILSQLFIIKDEAARLENKGDTDQAIKLYEQLVDACFDDPQPFLRLCNFYIKFHEPEKAAQVCVEYIRMAQTLNALGCGHPYRDELVESFVEISRGLDFSHEADEYYREYKRARWKTGDSSII